jgi:glucosamine-6-phosphate deaminase
MKIIVKGCESEFNHEAAMEIVRQINSKPESAIGLALGTTTLDVHKELVRIYENGMVDFSRAAMFIVDETMGIPSSHPTTGSKRIHDQLYDHINIKKENAHTPNGMTIPMEEECKNYDKKIESYGGLDLQVLGIGVNGHVGFDEPGTPFESITHIVRIPEVTRRKKLRDFNSMDEVPQYGITLGIKTIMMARRILLLAKGKEKAEIIRRVLFGPVSIDAPASVLQLHPELIVVLDSDAAGHISNCM